MGTVERHRFGVFGSRKGEIGGDDRQDVFDGSQQIVDIISHTLDTAAKFAHRTAAGHEQTRGVAGAQPIKQALSGRHSRYWADRR